MSKPFLIWLDYSHEGVLPAIDYLRKRGFTVKTETDEEKLFKKLRNKELPLVYCIITSEKFVLDLELIDNLERLEFVAPVIVCSNKTLENKKLSKKCQVKGARIAKDSRGLKKQLMEIVWQDVPILLHELKSKRKFVIWYVKKSGSFEQYKTFFLLQGIEVVRLKSRKKVYLFLIKNPWQVKCVVTSTGPVLEEGSTFLYDLKTLVCDLKIIVFSATTQDPGEQEIRNTCEENEYVDCIPKKSKNFKKQVIESCYQLRTSLIAWNPKRKENKKHPNSDSDSDSDSNSDSFGEKNKFKHNKFNKKKKYENKHIQIIWVSQVSNTISEVQKKIREKGLNLKIMDSLKETIRYTFENPDKVRIIICNATNVGNKIQNKLQKGKVFINILVYDEYYKSKKKRKNGSLKIISSKDKLIKKIYKQFNFKYDNFQSNHNHNHNYNGYNKKKKPYNQKYPNQGRNSIIVLDPNPYRGLIDDLIREGLNVITVKNIKNLKSAIKNNEKKIKVIITTGSFILQEGFREKVDPRIFILIFSKSGYQKEFIKKCIKYGAKFVSNSHQSVINESLRCINKGGIQSTSNNKYDNNYRGNQSKNGGYYNQSGRGGWGQQYRQQNQGQRQIQNQGTNQTITQSQSQNQSQYNYRVQLYQIKPMRNRNQRPRIECVNKSKYIDIKKQFLNKWELAPPNIAGIFRVVPPRWLTIEYKKYQNLICKKYPKLDKSEPFVGRGNERRRFHAADFRCKLGLDNNYQFCNNPFCTVCGVCKKGFSSKTESYMYSQGEIYCTTSAFKALLLSTIKNTTHVAIFVVTVICGNPIYLQNKKQKIPNEPHSLVIDYGKHRDLTLVLSKFHILPKYLIIFK
ncbi:c2h2-like zinc finger protein [Anaeramoeba flamelloides]|uniref:C2h2-like zinc finger protein n=1 Tax=Anaeramoeba flamelloides TaxID=1746091 RepID=A0AAV7YJN5_9EUKA|nr:c2h2-like zinc finger protein [Anaeramoeba flamelloides]